jgi:hypothetical protein
VAAEELLLLRGLLDASRAFASGGTRDGLHDCILCVCVVEPLKLLAGSIFSQKLLLGHETYTSSWNRSAHEPCVRAQSFLIRNGNETPCAIFNRGVWSLCSRRSAHCSAASINRTERDSISPDSLTCTGPNKLLPELV